MERRVLNLLPIMLVGIIACGVLPSAPSAAPTFTPNRIATGVAEAKAIAATLTAEAPLVTPTLTPAWPALEPTSTYPQVPATVTPHSPTPSSGGLKGSLTGANSQRPLSGAMVILCLIIAEKKCSLKVELVATVTKDGSFQLGNVPSGTYVIFYNVPGETKSNWKDIDGREISLKLEGLIDLPTPERKELFSTFGGGGAIKYAADTRLESSVKDGVVVRFTGNGSITSVKYGLTMDFHEGKPITVEVQPGKVTEVDIYAWAQ